MTKAFKEIKKMKKDERANKMKELKLELIKSKINSAKTGSSKTKQIKKMIARILTINNLENRKLNKE